MCANSNKSKLFKYVSSIINSIDICLERVFALPVRRKSCYHWSWIHVVCAHATIKEADSCKCLNTIGVIKHTHKSKRCRRNQSGSRIGHGYIGCQTVVGSSVTWTQGVQDNTVRCMYPCNCKEKKMVILLGNLLY